MKLLHTVKLWALPPDTRRGHFARTAWRRIAPRRQRNWHPELFDGLAKSMDAVRFVQIGSNDAGYGDPLRFHILHNGWRGLMIEPVPFIYQRLLARYRPVSGLQFANVAIGESAGSRPFFHLRASNEPSLPPWYDQLGSFDRQHLLKHQQYLADLPERIVESTVECQRFDALCAHSGISQFDLLHIDTEGYDWKILQTIDLTRYQPTVILFEHRHLPAAEMQAALLALHGTGYLTHNDLYDTVAVKQSRLAALAALNDTWTRVRAAVGSNSQTSHSAVGAGVLA